MLINLTRSQCLGTGMTRRGYWDDTEGATRMTASLTTFIPLLVSGI
ncbi:hypothetical protein [Wolbachia endosymbiont (group A) of Pogonocherus hispidulus]